MAEQAADTGDPAALVAVLSEELEHQVVHRLEELRSLVAHGGEGVPAARAATSARLGLLVWAHKVHLLLHAEVHEDGHSH
ncbi:MAG: hypothetical protein WD638_10390 [Nitriliruptoraceae bacterium]